MLTFKFTEKERKALLERQGAGHISTAIYLDAWRNEFAVCVYRKGEYPDGTYKVVYRRAEKDWDGEFYTRVYNGLTADGMFAATDPVARFCELVAQGGCKLGCNETEWVVVYMPKNAKI